MLHKRSSQYMSLPLGKELPFINTLIIMYSTSVNGSNEESTRNSLAQYNISTGNQDLAYSLVHSLSLKVALRYYMHANCINILRIL